MLRRPKPGDTEEDLLRYQEEFLASQSAPAASVTRKPGKRKPQEDEGEQSMETTDTQVQKDVVSLGGKNCFINEYEFARDGLTSTSKWLKSISGNIISMP